MALDPDLAERGHVEQADGLAHRHVFALLVVKPVLPLPRILVFALLAFIGEPVGTFPAGHFSKHCATCFQLFMDRRTADAAGGLHLPVGVVISVKQAKRFGHPLAQIMPVFLKRLRPADVDFPQVERRLAIIHPLRQRESRTAG